eukprot:6180349-Pleurochrysis_carterae.AAC.3
MQCTAIFPREPFPFPVEPTCAHPAYTCTSRPRQLQTSESIPLKYSTPMQVDAPSAACFDFPGNATNNQEHCTIYWV